MNDINFNNKKVLVLGLQKSGKAAIRLLKALNVEIYVSDEKVSKEEIEHFDNSVKYIEYDQLIKSLKIIDIIVKSPGIKYDISFLKKAKAKKKQIISEIELAFQFIDPKKVIIGVTGTNGKTTTTSLITKILIDSNISAISVGNIGYSLCDAIVDKVEADVYVTELSSFQLLNIVDFRPHIGVLLNISPAHIDYHNTYKNYINAKFNMLQNMGKQEYIVYNNDDKIIRDKVVTTSIKMPFSLENKTDYGYYENNKIYYRKKEIVNCDDLKLLGLHNVYNIVAAINVAKIFDLDNEKIAKSIKEFDALPHRIQFIENVNGVTYYNDSKSTNITSTICALNAFKEKVTLILGGLDRGHDFSEIMKHPNVKSIIAYGETKEKIKNQAEINKISCIICQDLQDVINKTQEIKGNNDIVLFSPACASWDQFKDYVERGEYFIKLVKNIK